MNKKTAAIVLSVLVLTVFVSGCTDNNTSPVDGTVQGSLTVQEAQTVNELESNMIDESETVEIGEMI